MGLSGVWIPKVSIPSDMTLRIPYAWETEGHWDLDAGIGDREGSETFDLRTQLPLAKATQSPEALPGICVKGKPGP